MKDLNECLMSVVEQVKKQCDKIDLEFEIWKPKQCLEIRVVKNDLRKTSAEDLQRSAEGGVQNHETRHPAIIPNASDQIQPIKSCPRRIRRRRDSNP